MPTMMTVPPETHGLTFLRKGFGRTPSDDVLFALGYPHIVVATDEPMPEVTVENLYRKFPLGTTHVPRVFLSRYFEALQCGADTEGIERALAKDPPAITAAKVGKVVKTLLEHGNEYDYLVLEAMVGSTILAEATVAALEGYPTKAWNGAGGVLDTYGGDILKSLYFVLLRVPTKTRKSLCARLEKLYKAGKKYQGGRPIDALDVLLHGRKGVERGGYRDADEELFQDLIYADDDPAWVSKVALGVLAHLKPADYGKFDLRMAFLGGAKLLAAMKSGVNKFPSGDRSSAKRQLARVR
jgi:hypothetical protein